MHYQLDKYGSDLLKGIKKKTTNKPDRVRTPKTSFKSSYSTREMGIFCGFVNKCSHF